MFSIDSAGDNTIGGATAAAGNLIHDNGEAGVVVEATASTGNVITADQIYGNNQQDLQVNQGPALEVVLAADARGGLDALARRGRARSNLPR